MEGLLTQLHTKKAPQGRAVWILRHGQTKLNKEDKIRGWSDVPLDDVGIEQAIDLGEAIKVAGVELDGIFSSDLVRSVQTSLEISKMTGIPILGTTKKLRPWNVGSFTGKDGKMVHKILTEYARFKPDEEVGSGESFNIFKHRILVGIVGLLNSNRGLKLGFVSHSRGERILHAWVAAGCPEDLEVDLDVFLDHGEGTATGQELLINCPLVFT